MRTCLLLIVGVLPAAAQPLISAHSVLNTASFMPAGLPGGSIARGAFFSLFGSRLGPTPAQTSTTVPLLTSLGNVTVQVTQGSTTVTAPLVSVGATQINAIMPSNAPLGAASIYVSFNNQKSPPAPVRIVADSFGIFTDTSLSFGQGAIENALAGGLAVPNSVSNPATPGQAVLLFGTGLGAVPFPDNAAPTPGNLPTQVEVFVGGELVKPLYSGRSGQFPGEDQINFTVPNDVAPGCWVPVQVRTSGVTVSNTATMAISADGSPCSDPLNAISAPFRAGQRIGLVALLRTAVLEDVGLVSPGMVTAEAAMMSFQTNSAGPYGPFNPIYSLPPAGACATYSLFGDLFDGSPIAGADVGATFLNAGTPLTVVSATDNRKLSRPTSNARNLQPLGYTYTGSLVPSSLFLNPGTFTVAGPGAAMWERSRAP